MSTFNDECMREKNLRLFCWGEIATFHVFLNALYSSSPPTLVEYIWIQWCLRWFFCEDTVGPSPTLTFVIFCFLVSLRECQAQPSVKYPFSRNWTTLMWFSFWTWYMPTKTFSWFLSTWTWTWKNIWMIFPATMMTGQGYQKTCQR